MIDRDVGLASKLLVSRLDMGERWMDRRMMKLWVAQAIYRQQKPLTIHIVGYSTLASKAGMHDSATY
jgi:hypothetical protein